MGVAVVQERLFTAQSALDFSATLGPGRASRAKEWQVLARYGAGTSAGVVTVETAADPNDAGAWASVGTIPWTAASKTEKLQFTGTFHNIRVRISTAVVGGTITSADILGTN